MLPELFNRIGDITCCGGVPSKRTKPLGYARGHSAIIINDKYPVPGVLEMLI
jgi:hypothetical protein